MSQPARLAPKPIESMLARAGNSKSNHPNMNTPHPLLPPEWNGLAEDMARYACINKDTAELLMSQSLALACGNTIKVRTPERRDLGPAFNLALVSPGFPMPRGALMELLGPIPDYVKFASEQMEVRGMETLKAQFEMKRNELREVEEALQKEESLQKEARESQETADFDAYMERLRMGPALGSYHPAAIQAKILECKKRKGGILAIIDRLIFQLHHGVLVDEPEWRELPKLGEKSINRIAHAMCFANGPGSIADLTAQERTACSQTLNNNRIGAPSVTMVTSGTEGAYAGVLSTKAIRRSGILSGFLFVEAANEAPDSAMQMQETEALARWQQLVSKCFDRRLASQMHHCDLCVLDEKGFAAFLEFRKWVRVETSFAHPEVEPFLSMLPDLCLQLALIRTAMAEAPATEKMPGECVEQAADFLRRIGRRHRELLERMVVEQPEDEILEQQVGRLVEKLGRRGPLTKRGIARCMHNQDYGRLEPILQQGLKRGDIIQAGNLFRVPPVSVSASA